MSNKSNFKDTLKIDTLKEEYIPNRQEAASFYSEYTNSQKAQFIALLNFLCYKLEEFKSKCLLSERIEFIARIKSPASALDNHLINSTKKTLNYNTANQEKTVNSNTETNSNQEQTNNSNTEDNSNSVKKLDDCFGITFLYSSPDEQPDLENFISQMTIMTKKKLPKENGHNVIHTYNYVSKTTVTEIRKFLLKTKSIHPKDINQYNIDTFPLVEIQYKTFNQEYEDTRGKTAHWRYKGINPQLIIKKYKNNEFIPRYNIPYMYEYDPKEHKVFLLDDVQTLMKEYPFIFNPSLLEDKDNHYIH